jgi:hypothetical protein
MGKVDEDIADRYKFLHKTTLFDGKKKGYRSKRKTLEKRLNTAKGILEDRMNRRELSEEDRFAQELEGLQIRITVLISL